MKQLVLVGVGGFIGSAVRYKLSGLLLHYAAAWRFPLPTFLVNLLGCLLIGFLAGLTERREFFSNEARLFLFTGLLGGFTTFSAFGLEGIQLLRRGELAIALSYAALSVCLGFLAVWVGMVAGSWRS